MRIAICVSILTLAILNLSGCANIVKKDSSAAKSASLLEPSVIVRFADVPVPSGFKLLAKNSYSFENSGVRVGVLRYQGRSNSDSVLNFYKEQMPMYNWNLLNIVEYGDRMMNFERENETCIVNISPKWNTTLITVSLGPKSQAIKKSSRTIK